jgi:aconitate hydratase
MGVLALQHVNGESAETLGLTGRESFTIEGLSALKPRQTLTVRYTRPDGSTGSFDTLCRIDTENEIDYFYAGGILPYVLRKLAA